MIYKHKIFNSRFLNYFLTADDKKFEERKNSEVGLVGNLMNKLKKPSISASDLKLSDTQRTKVVLVL